MPERLVEERDAVSLVLASVQGVKNLSTQQWKTADDEWGQCYSYSWK